MILSTGKLDSDLLKTIVFDKIKYRSEEVKVRPGIGEDCAVMDFGDYDCIMSTDPISSAVSDIGRLAIHITCNDIASNGVRPLGIMLAVMLPEGTTDDDVEHIMGQAAETAASLKVEIIGGHTEISPAVKQPIIVSTAIGKIQAGQSASSEDIEVGDYIMMTKSVGLEGTGIIASDFEDEIIKATDSDGGRLVSDEEIQRAKSFLQRVSVVEEGCVAGSIGTHGMHDITEGGILGAIWEMCQIAGKDAEIWEENIPIEPETKKICDIFSINPLRFISSGSMIILVAEDKKEAMAEAMAEAGVPATYIGRIVARGQGTQIDPPGADELYKVVGRN